MSASLYLTGFTGALAGALLAFAPAALADEPPPAQAGVAQEVLDEDDDLDPARCVRIRTISGYTVIDDRHMLIQGGPSRHYLVTTRQRCSGLRFGSRVGVSFGANERICRPFMEYIIPEDGWRCMIDTIEEVDSPDHARDLIARRAERG
ncbi:hypothetical protein F1654_03120 [Alkalicaulis satelles]|uniref:Secreted protein n=1 Tax=Alkalicaulis satelles TaxID=2609175 RepID=A0A5M6ZRU0_9PROT|nr:DUF6491 family protein [Alkalicaulis satelles]KAA5805001.1 hypothetical protein F1654_03120 [Alkalicaulis satelles]